MTFYVGEEAHVVPGDKSLTITVEIDSVRYTFKPDWGDVRFYRYPEVEAPLTLEEIERLRLVGPLGGKSATPEDDVFVSMSAFGRNCDVVREEIDPA